MDPTRFDALARTVARAPRSRRAALRGVGTLGLGAALGGVFGRRAAAQEATPPATPAGSGELIEFLYIQTHDAGTLLPKSGQEGIYELHLTGGTGHTTYFADRPGRQVGIAPTERVLAAIGIGGDDPPNAGLVAHTDAGERVLVVELLSARFDDDAESLTYDVRLLADYDESALSHLADKVSDESLPERFGASSLFIDGGGCPYPICGGICCDASEGMVCQGQGAYCTSVYQSGVCQGGNACAQGPQHACNPGGGCHCGTDVEGGGACLTNDQNICGRHACSSSSDCAYGKLCVTAPCCGDGAQVCMPLCQS
jgi:hypothetical protein